MEISLSAYLGNDSPTTTKPRGELEGSYVVVLVDSGATHNFVTTKLIEREDSTITGNTNLQILLETWLTIYG